jgi:hypothetical protein
MARTLLSRWRETRAVWAHAQAADGGTPAQYHQHMQSTSGSAGPALDVMLPSEPPPGPRAGLLGKSMAAEIADSVPAQRDVAGAPLLVGTQLVRVAWTAPGPPAKGEARHVASADARGREAPQGSIGSTRCAKGCGAARCAARGGGAACTAAWAVAGPRSPRLPLLVPCRLSPRASAQCAE